MNVFEYRVNAAVIAYRKQAVYDVDAVQGVFKRFALFINQIPVEHKVQIIRLLIEKVIISNTQIEVRLHELPVGDVQKALDRKLLQNATNSGEKAGRKVVFSEPIVVKQDGAKPATNKNCHRNNPVAEFGQEWRGWQDVNTTETFASDSLKSSLPQYKIPLIPQFSIVLDYALELIANGEKMLEETGDAFNLPMDVHNLAKIQIPSFLNGGITTAF